MTALKEKVRAVTFLTRQQIDFLDKLGKDALFYGGSKISRAQILSELVNLLIALGIDTRKMHLHQDTLAHELIKIVNHNGHHPDKENDQ